MTRITITGNLTSDPEAKWTQSGKRVTKFSVAVSEGKEKESSFYRVTVWDDMGDNVVKSLSKGQRVIVEGRLQIRQYEQQLGGKGTSVDVTADSVGPDLRFATATVVRNERGQGGQSAPAQAPAQQQAQDAWAGAPAADAGDPWQQPAAKLGDELPF